MEIIEGYDVIVDGLDNFPTRYLLNDASVRLQIPVVSASILGFEGQLSVFHPYEGPCYRCLYPTPPPAELAPSCGAAGVLGVLPGVMGLLQSVEVIKLVTGAGDTMAGRLLLYDALGTTFTELKVRRDPDCPICSRDPDSISDEEMGVFPDYEARSAPAPGCGLPAHRRVLGLLGVRPLSGAGYGSCRRMSTVKIPPVLRASVGGAKEVEASGASVGEVLRSLAEQHPATESQLFSEDGDLNRYVNVYLNDEDVRVLDGLDTGVARGDTIVILPAMAGGARLIRPATAADGRADRRAAGRPRRARRSPSCCRRATRSRSRSPSACARRWATPRSACWSPSRATSWLGYVGCGSSRDPDPAPGVGEVRPLFVAHHSLAPGAWGAR